MTEWEEQEVFGALRRGCKEALSQLFLRYHQLLYGHGIKLTQDRFQVEECIQELFLYLYERHDRLGSVNNVKVYLLKSFRRRLIKATQSTRKLEADRVKASEFMPIYFTMDEIAFANGEAAEVRQLLLDVLNDLAPRQKEAIHLRYYSGLSTAEIAEIMDVADQTILNTIHHALKKIRKNDRLSLLNR